MVQVETERRGKQTVAGYAPGRLEGQALLEANSVEIARSALKRIMPHLGSKAHEHVTIDDVRRMLGALTKSGLSNVTDARTLDAASSRRRRHHARSGPGDYPGQTYPPPGTLTRTC